MLTQTFEKRDPRKLKPHPLHLKLYPTRTPSQQMLDEIADIGIQQPPIILPDDTIISGHCRTQAAIAANITEIRVIVRHDLEDKHLETQQLVISLNATQVNRDNATRCREAAHLADIIKQINQQRQKLFLKQFKTDYQKLQEPDTEHRSAQSGGTVNPAETREVVAETLNVSRRTAENMIAVGRAISNAEDSGDNNTADSLTTAANLSISKTARHLDKPTKTTRKAPHTPSVISTLKHISDLLKSLQTHPHTNQKLQHLATTCQKLINNLNNN